jgi:Ribonuclease G/E
MAKEICISSTPHETRLAILEDDQLAEIYYERENEYTLAGSIYNGRVTRVLPGMQSAFVDIGLERDAFLYVTDFLELEESEDSDEVEKAAATGGNQPPREVRQGDRGQRNGGREQREPRTPERAAEPSHTELSAPAASPTHEQEDAGDGSEDPGAKRWRGRRRRRGGRGSSNVAAAPAGESEEFLDTNVHVSASAEPEAAEETHAPAAPRGARSEQKPDKFVLPGESLSKYGGTPAETTKAAETPAPPRPASTYKPATLIESPIVWDGSGLLPGESLSRHRGGRTEQPSVPAAAIIEDGSADEIEEQDFVEEMAPEDVEPQHEAGSESEQAFSHSTSALPDDDIVEETFEAGSSGYQSHAVADEPELGETVEPEIGTASESQVGFSSDSNASEHAENESTEHEGDRSASHHVDPLPPAEFRLFGLGGKKKRSDEEPPEGHEAAQHSHDEPRAASIPAVSAFSPGSGVVEEEVIEGEEYDLGRQHHKGEEHDLDDYEEEEKLHTQIRSGELGEMLQEAHLDHRIQLDFDDKNGEEGDDEAEEEEPVAAEGQPAGDGHAPQRRERGGRGRRGGRGDRGGDRGQRPDGRRGPSRRSAQTSDLPIISDLLKPGQEILVQIAKEPIAKKGARITSHIALPGRFLVFMPTVTHVGVSRKIASDEERQRLKRILTHERGDASGGFIVRTAAEGASEEELRADLRFLIHLWNEIKQRSEGSKSPALIYHDLSLIERILRDQVSSNFSFVS